MVIIRDGGLPSNVGGGSNLRNIIRRVFAILKKNGWWEQIGGLKGLNELFESHIKDLSLLYGEFPEYKSFNEIIAIEYERWANTESGQQKKLVALIEKANKKKEKLSMDDWINAVVSWGIPVDVISQLAKQPIPGDLYKEIDDRQAHQAKAQEQIVYDTIHLPETENLYYVDHRLYRFDAKIVAILQNKVQKEKGNNIVILNRSAFYPTSGGQVHDKGAMNINGKFYNVINVEKVGKCFLHHL
jgi:alanyl-tRNA synthetase